ncbi:MAG: ubiquitin-like small modifier protein 1 [Fervidicoccaceae archaeon]
MVHVKVFATLIDIVGSRTIEINGPRTVRELIDALDSKYPGFKKELERGFLILVNGSNITEKQGLNTEIEEDDTVSIFPPVGGG